MSLWSLLDCLDEFEPHWRLVFNIKHCSTESVNVLWRYLWFLKKVSTVDTFSKKVSTVDTFSKKCPPWTLFCLNVFHVFWTTTKVSFRQKTYQTLFVWVSERCVILLWCLKKVSKKVSKMDTFSKKCPRRTLFFSGHIFSILTHKKGLFSTLGPCFSPLPCVFPFKLI